jgi:hypothetical protein
MGSVERGLAGLTGLVVLVVRFTRVQNMGTRREPGRGGVVWLGELEGQLEAVESVRARAVAVFGQALDELHEQLTQPHDVL